MKLKSAEFLTAKKNIANNIEALSALFKADIAKEEKESMKLEKEKALLESRFLKASERLEELKLQLLSQEAVHVDGFDEETLSNPEKLEEAVSSRKAARTAIDNSVKTVNQFKTSQGAVKELADQIIECESSIKELEDEIVRKAKEMAVRRENFIKSTTALSEKLCTSSSLNIQKIKASLAGQKIQLRSDAVCEQTVSLQTLKRLNALAMLLDVKAELEKTSLTAEEKAELAKTTTETLLEQLSKLQDNYDEKDFGTKIFEEKSAMNISRAAKAKATVMRLIGNVVYGKNSGSKVMETINGEVETQGQLYKTSSEKYGNLVEARLEADEMISAKGDEYIRSSSDEETKTSYSEGLKKLLVKMDSDVLTELQDLLEDPTLDTATALERVFSIIDQTPYEVSIPRGK